MQEERKKLSDRLLNISASVADFIHKLQISLKELNETLYWLILIDKAQINSGPEIKALAQENKELCAIVARSVLTAKNRSRAKL